MECWKYYLLSPTGPPDGGLKCSLCIHVCMFVIFPYLDKYSKNYDCRTKSTWTKRTAHRQKVFGQKVPGIGQKVPHFIKKGNAVGVT